MKTTVNIILDKKFNKHPKLAAKIMKASTKMEEVINTVEFKEFIMGHSFQKGLAFADCADESHVIYERLMSGAETLDNQRDHEWDITIIPYYKRFSKAIGYTYPSKKEIWVNLKYYSSKGWTEGDCAGNMSHEWTHKAGFKHSYKRNWVWPFTVPYAVGNYVKKMVNNMNSDLHLEEVESGGLNHMSWVRRAWYRITNIF